MTEYMEMKKKKKLVFGFVIFDVLTLSIFCRDV